MVQTNIVDLVMPKLGESIMEATILKWHKQPGDKVAQDETILDIATDKVDSEVPSTAEGIIEEILYNENDVVPIGKVIARIKVGADSNAHLPSSQQPSQSQPSKQEYEEADVVDSIPYVPANTNTNSNKNAIRFYSPLVLNIAANEGVAMSELENLTGTGQDGRVSKKDIIQYIEQRKTGSPKPQAASNDQRNQKPVFLSNNNNQQEEQNTQLQTCLPDRQATNPVRPGHPDGYKLQTGSLLPEVKILFTKWHVKVIYWIMIRTMV